MKIELGESLLQSYLKHVRKCYISQTNWKTSSSWIENDKIEAEKLWKEINQNTDYANLFKDNKKNRQSLDQVIKQAEIDVVGFDYSQDIVYMVEVAFHEDGLNYNGKERTNDKICEKMLRAYLISKIYFPGKQTQIIFASPKTSNTTLAYINEERKTFANLNTLARSKGDKVTFSFITNEDFENVVLKETLKNSEGDSDTSELFLRSYKMLNLFYNFS